MVFKSIIGVSCACLTVISTSVQASVIESSDVLIGGSYYETFVDTTTNLTWLDLDNFWDTSTYNTIATLLSGSGFRLAGARDLAALQASIPSWSSTFAREVAIIGGNYIGNPHPGLDREIMWGIYNDGTVADGVSYSWRSGFDNDVPWNYRANAIGADDELISVNPDFMDLGAWVVTDDGSPIVPTPAAAWLFGSGLIGLIGLARRKKA